MHTLVASCQGRVATVTAQKEQAGPDPMLNFMYVLIQMLQCGLLDCFVMLVAALPVNVLYNSNHFTATSNAD